MDRYPNRYPAKCVYCQKRVDPYGGLCWKVIGINGWTTAHEHCIPDTPMKPAKVATPDPGMHGPAPVMKIPKKDPNHD